ncbi:MAG: ferrous iron transport protein B [bacterium]|nr:ferrous iron transport protein B [bacterium]
MILFAKHVAYTPTPTRRLVAIAGNPNSGKTTLFNRLTGARQKVGNYPGVTVERKTGQLTLPSGNIIDVVDLPGSYSIAARSPEEQISHDVLSGFTEGLRRPDTVVVVLDATNVRRNLYLATQLRDMGVPLVVALNMIDLARERGFHIDCEKLSVAIGCPVVPLVARSGEGVDLLLEKLDNISHAKDKPGQVPRFIDQLPPALEPPVTELADGLVQSKLTDVDHARAEALWLLISTLDGDEAVSITPTKAALTKRVLQKSGLTTQEVRAIETSGRYQYLRDLMTLSAAVEQDLPHRVTQAFDRVLLHRVLGPIVFLSVMAIVFQSIFSWAEPAMGLTESFVGWLSGAIASLIPAGLFRDLVVDGAVAGFGNVIVFLPQILLLFFFIGLLEDSGYMARAAFLMDRIMSKVGLDGRAFVPLLSSFACAIPGIMATRTIASRKDRLVTILVAPLMSCSARLPVYTLIIGTVFAANHRVLGVFSIGGLVLMAMYLLSIFAGISIAALFKKTILKSPPPPLYLELPTYKLPSLRSVVLNLLDRAKLFVVRAGTVIMAATVVLWALMNFQIGAVDTTALDQQRAQIEQNTTLASAARDGELAKLDAQEHAMKIEQSLGGQIGKLIEPVIAPLGFDWRMGVGIIASFAAREVFVSSLAVVHGISYSDDDDSTLRETLQTARNESGAVIYTPLVGLALMVFFVLACQCMSTVAIVRRETNSWSWPAFMVGYMSVLAWLGAWAVYQGGKLIGLT